jgi:hypothetical protein
MMGSHLHSRRWLPFTVAMVALTTSCNFIVEPDRVQCATDSDCAKRGARFEGAVCERSMCVKANPWKCLDAPPPPPTPVQGPFQITIHAQNILSSLGPIKGAAVSFCAKLDLECKDPLNEPGLVTDDNGDATVTLTASFSGYVSVVPPDDPMAMPLDKFAASYWYPNPAITATPAANQTIQVGNFGTIALLTGAAQAEQRDDRGLALINVVNCANGPAQGIVYTSDQADEETTAFYVKGGLPAQGLTATDTTGYGGFINLPPGAHTINGDVQETGQRLGTTSVNARPRTITLSRLVPVGQSP